jgi:hypothetical protein
MKPVKILSVIVAGLWLSACTQAVSPDATQSKKEETAENRGISQTPSSETAESKQQETRKKSDTGEAASPDATQSEQEQGGKGTNVRPATSQDTADAKLEAARENLRISQATEERIASELEQLKKSGKASPEAIRDYEIYHERVQAMVAENRKMVKQMEAVQAKYTPADSGVDTAPGAESEKLRDPNIPEAQTMDDVAVLDRELDTSLAKFDDMLLKEMDAIRAESAKKMQGLAEEAADAAKRLRTKGVDVNTSESEPSAEAEEGSMDAENEKAEEAGAPEKDQGMEREESQSGTATASGDEYRKDDQGPAKREPRRNYEDDDIVARQLREAAENETDPELKEKLWQEYEEYKQNKR